MALVLMSPICNIDFIVVKVNKLIRNESAMILPSARIKYGRYPSPYLHNLFNSRLQAFIFKSISTADSQSYLPLFKTFRCFLQAIFNNSNPLLGILVILCIDAFYKSREYSFTVLAGYAAQGRNTHHQRILSKDPVQI